MASDIIGSWSCNGNNRNCYEYDARILTKRFFSFGDQNDASLGLKILGFLIAIGGALLVFFQF